MVGAAVESGGGDEMVAALHGCENRRAYGGHARGGAHRRFALFQSRDLALHNRCRGIAPAGVDGPVLLLEGLSGLLGAREDIGVRHMQRRGDILWFEFSPCMDGRRLDAPLRL